MGTVDREIKATLHWFRQKDWLDGKRQRGGREAELAVPIKIHWIRMSDTQREKWAQENASDR